MKQPDNQIWDNPGNEIIRRTGNNFQGRLEEIRIFHERTNWLRNHMHEDSLVTNYWGFGGIGKTWLIRKLSQEAKKHGVKYIGYEFDESATSSDPAVVILYLASAISKSYKGDIWKKTYVLLRKYGVDGSALERDFSKIIKTYDAVDGLVDAGLTVAAAINPEAAILKAISDLYKNYKISKSAFKNSKYIGEQLGKKKPTKSSFYMTEESLSAELAEAFSEDLEVLLNKQDKPLVIALDGLDRYYRYASDDDWLKLMIKKTNDIHWILAGRDELTWDDDIWKMEADEEIPHLLPVAVSALSKEEAYAYFMKAEVADEEEFLGYLYQLTDGIPLYMYLCVDIYVDLLNRGIEPSKDAFQIEVSKDSKHKHYSKLIQRWAEDHPDEIRELAAAYKWNDEVLKDRHISISPQTKDWYALSKGKSIFQYDQKGNCSFHDVIQEVIMDDALNKGMYGFMNHMQANAVFYIDAVKNDGNPTVTDTGIDVLLYYLSLENESWYNGTVNKTTLLECLRAYCKQLDDNGNWQYLLELSKRLLRIVEENCGFTVEDRDALYYVYAGACFNMGDYGKALEYYREDLKLREEALGHEHPLTAATYNNIGRVNEAMGLYGKALEYYQKVLRISEGMPDRDCSSIAVTYNNIGGIHKEMGDYRKALECYQKALTIQEVREQGNPSTAATYNNIGTVYEEMSDYSKALEYYQKALQIRVKALGCDHPSTATTYNNIGGVYREMNDCGKALEYYQKALTIQEEVLGYDHPSTATTYNNIGGVYKEICDYDKALGYYQKALRIREEILGYDHPLTAATYNNLANVYKDAGDYGKALDYYQKALRISEEVLGRDHPSTASTYNNLAMVYEEMGDYDKALEYYRKALVIYEEVLEKDHPTISSMYISIGTLACLRKDYRESLNYLFKAFTVYKETLGEDHPDTQAIIAVLYRVLSDYLMQGNSLLALDKDLFLWLMKRADDRHNHK